MNTKTHIYSHLGKAPYVLVGYEYDPRVETSQGFQGGNHACDHCGRSIAHVFFIRSSDGKEFTLGSEHAQYLGDEGLVDVIKSKMKELRQESRMRENIKRNRAIAEERDKAKQIQTQKIKNEFYRIAPLLKDLPHPNDYFASKGKTMSDYTEFFFGDLDNIDDDVFYYNYKIHQIIRSAGGSV